MKTPVGFHSLVRLSTPSGILSPAWVVAFENQRIFLATSAGIQPATFSLEIRRSQWQLHQNSASLASLSRLLRQFLRDSRSPRALLRPRAWPPPANAPLPPSRPARRPRRLRPRTGYREARRRLGATQLTSDYVEANGIRLSTKRRAYTRGPDRRPILEMLMIAIDTSEVTFKQGIFLAQESLTALRHWAQPLSACCIAKPTLCTYMLPQQSTSP